MVDISFKYKVLLLGSAGVGKTSLLLRFVNDVFKEDYSATIGAQFLSKEVNLGLDENNEETKCQLNLWDIAGQTRFFDLRTTFYRGAHGALLIFDLTRKETLEDLNVWIKEMTPVLGTDLPILIIGNKLDLKKERKIKINEGKNFAKERKTLYLETSAATNENVEQAFWELARLIAAKEGKIKIPNKVVKQKVKKAGKEKGGASYIVKSKVKAYIKSQGMNTGGDLLSGNVMNRKIIAILDKAIEHATTSGRKTVQPEDIK